MTLQTFVKRSVLVTGVVGTVGLSGLATSAPAQAAAIDFNTFTPIGNTTVPGLGQATLATENSFDNSFGDLETFLGLDPNDFALNVPPGESVDPAAFAYQGSAFKTIVNAGDTINFNYNFSLFGTDKDYAFIVFNGAVENLAAISGSGLFARTFQSGGTFAIGVVDVGDFANNSTLTITNADVAPIPTPALLPGLLGLGLGAWRKRKQMKTDEA